MFVNEIFYSIDGEGLRTGELAIFIRLSGCNMNCSYCDTKYALKKTSGTFMSIDEIINEISKYNCKNITLTGGEPLLFEESNDLIEKLLERGYKINIETNGSIDITKYLGKCLITMDYKLPSSNMEQYMKLSNLEKLTENDVLKFVTEETDFETIKKILVEYNLKCYVYISPIFNKIEPYKIVEFMKKLSEQNINMETVRTQVQLHKVIWNPDERGV